MVDVPIKRKLTAILYTDAVDYSLHTGADEVGTHRKLSTALDLISNLINEADGRVVHYAGDAVLAEFQSIVAAVDTAVNIQNALLERSSDNSDDKPVLFRIGVNIGEVIVDRNDIYGDGVNITARLESLADPGGICISGRVFEQIEGKLALLFEDIGKHEVKNISKPLHVYAITPSKHEHNSTALVKSPTSLHQKVKFCTAVDGVQIAYSSVGHGPPIVKTANWLNHLEYDWESPVWSHLFHALAQEHTLVRFDQRGNGLSDWDAEDLSFQSWIKDMETVVEATGLRRFAILGISQGCASAIEYAVLHPEFVSHLILYGGYMRGKLHRGSPVALAQEEAMTSLISSGWGQDNPAFRQVFTSLLIPGASSEQMNWFNELQRRTTTPENAVRLRKIQIDINVTDLAARVTAPTLVLHTRDDAVVPFEEGRLMAATIPNARFVALEGCNHLFLENEPAWPRFLKEVHTFLEQ